MKRKHLVLVVLAVAVFAGIVLGRDEKKRPRKVTTVDINVGGETDLSDQPAGKIIGFACDGARCMALVEEDAK